LALALSGCGLFQESNLSASAWCTGHLLGNLSAFNPASCEILTHFTSFDEV
jgi:hypothetical protein